LVFGESQVSSISTPSSRLGDRFLWNPTDGIKWKECLQELVSISLIHRNLYQALPLKSGDTLALFATDGMVGEGMQDTALWGIGSIVNWKDKKEKWLMSIDWN